MKGYFLKKLVVSQETVLYAMTHIIELGQYFYQHNDSYFTLFLIV